MVVQGGIGRKRTVNSNECVEYGHESSQGSSENTNSPVDKVFHVRQFAVHLHGEEQESYTRYGVCWQKTIDVNGSEHNTLGEIFEREVEEEVDQEVSHDFS